jgi:hypothetical protein
MWVKREKNSASRTKKNMYVVLKSQIEIEEDIASFGLVYMAKSG